MDTGSLLPNIPYRIRIGVTGHRTLEEKKLLSDKVRSLLDPADSIMFDAESLSRIRASTQLPVRFSIITPLAEGADRLVAREVLKTPDAQIIPVLPLAQEDYMSDFKTKESRDEFESLLARSRRVITLTVTDAEKEAGRRRAYKNVGKYVVDHCDVLIALWDGKPASGEGGTAEIVEYARQKGRNLAIISTHPPFEVTVERPLKLDVQTMDSIKDFNAYEVSIGELDSYADNVAKDLFEAAESKSIAPAAKKMVREQLIPFYVKASKVAKRNQTIYLRSGSLVYLFSALAVATAALSIIFPAYSTMWFSIEAVLLLTIFLVVNLADRRRTHKKWIESRFLTERIRVAFFFAACGVEVSPIRIPPYLRVAHRLDDWMVRIFNEVWNRLPRLTGCSGTACADVSAFIRKQLIQDQIKYHLSKANERGRISSGLESAGKGIFFAALVATLLHIGFFSSGSEEHSAPMNHLLTYLALSLPAVGAAIGGIRTHREYSRLEKRSQNMVAALTELDERFAQVTNHEELESLLRETEELMLRETQDWLMLMRFVKLETAA